MKKIAGSLGKAIALFFPAWTCLYFDNLYALNYFALPSTYDTSTAILYGVYCISRGLISYILLIGLWWGLLNILWRNHPHWISPKSWKNIFVNWAIATTCLFLALLFEPSLWRSGNVVVNAAIPNGYYYLIGMTTSRFLPVFTNWIFLATICYLLKSYLLLDSQKKSPRSVSRQTKHPTDARASRAELRLSTYLFYDEKQARRLVDGVQAKYPDMSREWCAEKALSDLERDRRK